MRVNVYAEEIFPPIDEKGDRVTLETKTPRGQSVQFQGIQILLGKREFHTPTDDDTPGVTFWYGDETSRDYLIKTFQKALELLQQPEAKFPQ